MRLIVLLIGLVVGIAMASGAVRAHHAFAAEFDVNQPIVLKGVVSKAEWGNPHSWVYLEVKNDSGKTTTWAIECGAPNALLRRGWNKNSLPSAARLSSTATRPRTDGRRRTRRTSRFPDGRKLFMGSSGTGAPSEQKE